MSLCGFIADHYYIYVYILGLLIPSFSRLSHPFMRFQLCHLLRASSYSPVSFIESLDFARTRVTCDLLSSVLYSSRVVDCRYIIFTFYLVSTRGLGSSTVKLAESNAPIYLDLIASRTFFGSMKQKENRKMPVARN